MVGVVSWSVRWRPAGGPVWPAGAPSGFSAARGCPLGCCPPAAPPSGLTSSGWALGWVVAAEQRPLAPSPKMFGAGRVPVGVEKWHVQGQDECGGADDGDRCVVGSSSTDRVGLRARLTRDGVGHGELVSDASGDDCGSGRAGEVTDFHARLDLLGLRVWWRQGDPNVAGPWGVSAVTTMPSRSTRSARAEMESGWPLAWALIPSSSVWCAFRRSTRRSGRGHAHA